MKSGVVTTPVNKEERAALGLRAGDTVRVWQKIEELKIGRAANKKVTTTRQARTQAFEGLVLAVKHGTEPGATFTVRKVSSGVGVEKIFPLYSPMIDQVEVLRRTRTRRAKLYFIRRKATRDIKRAMRRSVQVAPAVKAVVVEPEIEAPIVETAAEEVAAV